MTPEHLERRRTVVGASEVGLLFGLPSFQRRTLSDLWVEKKYGAVPNKGNASTDMGNKLEPIVLEYAEKRLGSPIVDRQLWCTRGANGATIDGRVEGGGALVEAKTSGILWAAKDTDLWGPDESDEIPELYLLQAQCQLLVTGAELDYMAALIGGRGFCMFNITPHAALQTAIAARSSAFVGTLAAGSVEVAMDLYQAAYPTVETELPQIETLKRLYRQPGKTLDRTSQIDDAYLAFEEAKASAKETGEKATEAQKLLLTLLGDAEAAAVPGGLLTYQIEPRKEHTVAASKPRVLRFRKGK